MERLQKLLARAGVASRRASEELIHQGRVTVDGQVVTQPGARADPAQSVICVDGQPIRLPTGHHYLLLHKPAGYITTRQDQFGRPTVMDLVPAELRSRIYPVGRLDADTTGLLLLSDDGELANRLIHPRYHVPKTYLATVEGVPNEAELQVLRSGVELADGTTAPAQAVLVNASRTKATIRLTLSEGRNRQVKRMCEAVGHPVVKLVRIAMASLELDDLPEGEFRHLNPLEINELERVAFAED